MKKLLFTPFVLGLSLVPAFGADPVANPPAAPPPVNVTVPADGNVDDARVIVPLRTLMVVKDARERRTPWQVSEDDAVARIADPSLKSTVQHQLAAIGPQVAKVLIQQPSENAIVTVAVYKERGSDKQILAAVAFEGVGDGLNPSFYARVLANEPQVPGTQADLAEKLELDPIATSYLCLFIDHGDLKGDDITHAKMKQSLDLGIQQARLAASAAPAPQPPADVPAQPQPVQPVAPAPQPTASDTSAGPDYTTPYWDDTTATSVPYYGTDGWIPWVAYVPGYGQNAVIVNPNYQQREQWVRHEEAVAKERAVAAERRDNAAAAQVNAANVAAARDERQTAQSPSRLILPRAPRETGAYINGRDRASHDAGAVPRERSAPQGPLPGAHEPAREQPARSPEGAPAHIDTPARAEPAPHAEAPAEHSAPAPVAHSAPTPAKK